MEGILIFICLWSLYFINPQSISFVIAFNIPPSVYPRDIVGHHSCCDKDYSCIHRKFVHFQEILLGVLYQCYLPYLPLCFKRKHLCVFLLIIWIISSLSWVQFMKSNAVFCLFVLGGFGIGDGTKARQALYHWFTPLAPEFYKLYRIFKVLGYTDKTSSKLFGKWRVAW